MTCLPTKSYFLLPSPVAMLSQAWCQGGGDPHNPLLPQLQMGPGQWPEVAATASGITRTYLLLGNWRAQERGRKQRSLSVVASCEACLHTPVMGNPPQHHGWSPSGWMDPGRTQLPMMGPHICSLCFLFSSQCKSTPSMSARCKHQPHTPKRPFPIN